MPAVAVVLPPPVRHPPSHPLFPCVSAEERLASIADAQADTEIAAARAHAAAVKRHAHH